MYIDRGKAQAGLVEDEKLGVGHQGTADGEHLLFTARKGPRRLPPALFEQGEQPQYISEILLHVSAPALAIGPHLQIFHHCHVGEKMTALRALDDPELDAVVAGHLCDVLTIKEDLAAPDIQNPGNSFADRRLARAVGADDADHLPLVDIDGAFLQRQNGII